MNKKNYFDSKKASAELKERYNLHFADVLIKNGAKVYLFGGSLRDMVMGHDWKDADIRVWFSLPPKERDAKIEKLLKESGIDIKSKTPFGEAFTVFRFLPKGSKSDVGIDLSVVSDQWLVGPDFTINGLYFDIETGEFIDKYEAVKDIQKGIIKMAKDPNVQIKEEPYIIFRAIKCACQFGFEIEEKTFEAMKNLSIVTEGVIKMIADKEVPGFTEWFLGNMWRGLKYDPVRFEELWNVVGLTDIFTNFTAKRLGMPVKGLKSKDCIFKKGKKYGYEEALSIFLTVIAQKINLDDSENLFKKIIELYSITAPKKYEDFLIDISKIKYPRKLQLA